MKTIEIPLFADNENAAEKINGIIASYDDDVRFVFASGEYFLHESIRIENHRNIVIDAYGAVFKAYYNRADGANPAMKNVNPFYVNHCDGLTIAGATVQTDKSGSIRGKILADTPDYIDVEIDPTDPIDDCRFIHAPVFTADGEPKGGLGFNAKADPNRHNYENDRLIVAGEMVTTNHPSQPIPYTVIGKNRLRLTNTAKWVSGSYEGLFCALNCSYYGTSAFIFRNAVNVLLKDITIPNFGGMGFLLLPRCGNFTFDHVVLRNPDQIHSYSSTQSDGIHVLACTGYFVIKNSCFEATADDPLNIHTQLNNLTDEKDGSFRVIYNKLKAVVADTWAMPGDILRIYDVVTKEFKGTACVGEFTDGRVSFLSRTCEIRSGDFAANAAYFPTVDISDSRLVNGRGCLKIKSSDGGAIRNCEFIRLPKAIDLQIAYNTLEAGSVRNFSVEHNIFRQAHLLGGNHGVVRVGVRDKSITEQSHIHENIAIHGNCFEDNSGVQLSVQATDGVNINDNVFRNCIGTKVELIHCDRVNVYGNVEQ